MAEIPTNQVSPTAYSSSEYRTISRLVVSAPTAGSTFTCGADDYDSLEKDVILKVLGTELIGESLFATLHRLLSIIQQPLQLPGREANYSIERYQKFILRHI